MNALFVVALAFAAVTSANAGHLGHAGAVVSGPSGIVTSHGAIGPAGHGLGYAHGLGYGSGLGIGHGLGYGAAVIAAPALAYGAGHGLGLGYGSLGHAGYGLGLGHGLSLGHGAVVTNGGGVIGLSGHGVAVRGPHTVPAVIAGPSGKIVADGLYGVPHHGHHY